MTLETFLLIVAIQTILSALIAALAFYKGSLRSRLVKLVGLLYAFSCFCNVAAYLLQSYGSMAVNIPGSLYDLAFVIIVTKIYNGALGRKYVHLFNGIAIAFTTAAGLNLILLQQESIASFNKLAMSFILILYAVIYFYRLMKDLPTVHLTRLPMFWFNAAFLIYGAGALFLFAFLNYLVNVLNNDLMMYWTFHNVLTLVHQGIMIVGILYEMKMTLAPVGTASKNRF